MIYHANFVGGKNLRQMGFHERAKILKALANYLSDRKEELYELNPLTGATRKDGWIDIDGGIGTVRVYASKGRKEMPDGKVYVDGAVEQLSRKGSFLGQHIHVPKQGVAVHITPSYMLSILDEYKTQGRDPRESCLEVGIFGAEPWTNAMRKEVENSFDMHAVDIYGLSEVMGPGVANECVETKDGLHIWEDHFYPEIIDLKSNKPKIDGEKLAADFIQLKFKEYGLLERGTNGYLQSFEALIKENPHTLSMLFKFI